MIRILVVEDSSTEALVLKRVFEAEPDMQVIAIAKNGRDAIIQTQNLKPDIITMDVHMPIMDGIEAIRQIMSTCPTPIVVVSSKLNDEALNASYRALEAGALDVREKYPDILSDSSIYQRRSLVDSIRAMAGIRVVKRRFPRADKTPEVKAKVEKQELPDKHPAPASGYEVLVIGASVGGPQALKQVLNSLPENFPLPILVVQHMTNGFIEGFVGWLNRAVNLRVKAAEEGEILKPGIVYFAPDHTHLKLQRLQGKPAIHLSKEPPDGGFRPSVNVLFNSAAHVTGARTLALLLTGMGRDGAEGMLAIKHTKGHTIIQDEKSCVVFGMPGVAFSIGAVDKVVSLDHIADYLISVNKNPSQSS